MAALTAIAMMLGAAASVAGVVQSNNAAKSAKAQAAKQEQAAKNAAALETTATTTDPNVQLGTTDATAKSRTSATRLHPKVIKPGSAMATGGISASSVGGL